MTKKLHPGLKVTVFKDVEVEVDVYLEEFETHELEAELKSRKDFVDYKALYEEIGWFLRRIRGTKKAGDGCEDTVNQLLLAYRGDYR